MACRLTISRSSFYLCLLTTIFVVARAQPPLHLHIGMFDWDDNLLTTPAYIYLEYLLPNGEWVAESLTTKEFAEVQLRDDYKSNWRPSTTRSWLGDFSDEQGQDTFLNQVIEATKNLEQNTGGALSLLKSHLIAGFPVSIVTARSHTPRNILSAFQWFISSEVAFT